MTPSQRKIVLSAIAACASFRRAQPDGARARSSRKYSSPKISGTHCRADAQRGKDGRQPRQRPAGRWAVDHAGKELRGHPLLVAHQRSRPETRAALVPVLTSLLAVNKGQEAAPIVADNTMYVVTAYPNRVRARSHQARRAAQVEVRAAAAAGEPGRSLL